MEGVGKCVGVWESVEVRVEVERGVGKCVGV